MTETTENHTVHQLREPNRLYRALAWIGIAAGSIFIAGSIFVSGYVLGHNGGEHHGPHAMMLRPFQGPDAGPPPGGPDDGPRRARLTPPVAPDPSTPNARP